MIQLPFEKVLEKITQQSDLTPDDVEVKIKQKMAQLSGLISREGAAHIIANELNISLYDQFSGRVAIKDILPGLRDIEVLGKVLKIYAKRDFEVGNRKGTVASFLVGDESGKIRIVLWGSAAKDFEAIKEGNIVRVKGAYAKENNNYVEVHANDRSIIDLNPKGVDIKVDTATPRKKVANLSKFDNGVEVLATLVELGEPRFYEVCSECNRRVKEGNCPDHKESPLAFAYVLTGFLDDGTDNIRAVFFRDQAVSLLQKEDKEIQPLREDKEAFNSIKQELLGTLLKVTGRVNHNDMFDRNEFIVQELNLSPNPKDELARLQ